MAKKIKKQNKKVSEELLDNVLPQNILPIGERVEEDKNIYISQKVYKEIHRFTKNKTTDESGGMLVGTVVEEFGKTNIIISGFVEAKFCDATPTTLTFTHETWDFVHKEIEKKHKGKKIVGWIHTHPDFGIFLSEYDKFIQQNFFGEAHQVAYVIDPIQNIEGFYFWINGNIERCKGFYVYDKTGARITVDTTKEEADGKPKSVFNWKNILLVILAVVVAFLALSNVSLSNQMSKLENMQDILYSNQVSLVNSANTTLSTMLQLIEEQAVEIEDLREVLIQAGLIEEPKPEQTPEDTENSTEQEEAVTNE